MTGEHPHNEVRTAYLGKFGRFEAEIVLDILREAGIFAFNKQDMTENDHYAYAPLVEGEAGRILVDAERMDEARALIDRELPEHLRGIEESMRAMQSESSFGVIDGVAGASEPGDDV